MLVTVTAVGLLSASVASASFHLMNIRQVFGGNGNAANDYVELQMRSTGENFTGGHPIQVYNAVGLPQSAHPLTNVANGADQSTILIGDTGVASAFGVAPDVVVPGLEVSDFAMNGAVCYPAQRPTGLRRLGRLQSAGWIPGSDVRRRHQQLPDGDQRSDGTHPEDRPRLPDPAREPR